MCWYISVICIYYRCLRNGNEIQWSPCDLFPSTRTTITTTAASDCYYYPTTYCYHLLTTTTPTALPHFYAVLRQASLNMSEESILPQPDAGVLWPEPEYLTIYKVRSSLKYIAGSFAEFLVLWLWLDSRRFVCPLPSGSAFVL